MHKNNHKLRIGIVGAGNIVRSRHLPALKKRPDVEIVAVSNSTYESSERFCREHAPDAMPIKNWPDLVASPDIDIVWIGTAPYMHSAVTISASRRVNMSFVRHAWPWTSPRRRKWS